ncbi:MAG TPA: metal ABC transporter substrate-binding protein [Myxococcaceae bacterium]|nr:metal ABC transporter substrate-binding protein [Myxococcaceae bacterium]
MLGLAAVSVFLLLGASAEAKVNVVATTGDLGALAREVGGEHVDVKVLARPTQDPHFVDARPNLVLDVSNAHLLIINGLELEVGWLRVVITSARNPEVQPGQQGYLDASTLIQPKEVPRAAIDRSMGDLHTGGNPHYTLSPRNGLLVARGIAARLQAIDPDNAKAYAANLGRVEQSLGARIVEWEKALSPYKGADVVTYHKSWIYFVDWAGLDQVAFVEPKPGLPPNAGHVARVLAVIKQQKVPLILQEEWYPAATSEQLARLSGAKLVRVPGQTRDGQSYAEHIGQLVDATLKALRG